MVATGWTTSQTADARRRLERTIEIVTLFVHLYIIGEAAGHAYVSAFAAVA